MPQPLTKSELTSQTDPSVSKQWDTSTPKPQQIKDLYTITDALRTCLLTTTRPSVGPVARSMAIAKRTGPDFLFLANAHSNKFADLAHSPTVLLTFQNSSTQDWVSITGEAVTASHDDPRVKELWNKGTAAWFGDLGDGVHDASAQDPRVCVIEVRADYVSYWKAGVGSLGFLKEVGLAAVKGEVADTGFLREFKGGDVEEMRKNT